MKFLNVLAGFFLLASGALAADMDIENLTPVEDASTPGSPTLQNWRTHQRTQVSLDDLAAMAPESTTPPSKPAPEPEAITLWHGFPGESSKHFGTLVDDFNAEQAQKGTPYRIHPLEKGSYDDVLDAFLAAKPGERPDIVQAYEMATRVLRERRDEAGNPLYLPFHQVLKDAGEPDIDENTFIPAARDFYRAGGAELASLPFNMSTVVLYYNKTALDKTRVKPLKHWEEFMPQMALLKLNRQPIGLGAGWLSGHHLDQTGARHNKRIATLDNGVAGGLAHIDFDPFFEKHLKNLKDWHRQGLFSLTESAPANQEFADGKTVYLSQSANGHANVEKAVAGKFAIGVAPFPYWRTVTKAPYNTIAGGGSLWVVRKDYPAEKRKTIAQFLRFLAQKETQAKWQRLSGYVPVIQGAHEQNVAAGFFETPGLGPAAARIAHHSLTLPNRGHFSRGILLDRFPEIRKVEISEMKSVIQGKKPAAEAIRTIAQKGNYMLQEARRK